MAYECHNVGCRKTFKYRIERKRHMDNKCFQPPASSIPVSVDYKVVDDGRHECLKCHRTFAYKSGVQKHLRDNRCKGESIMPPASTSGLYRCDKCDKTFQYQSKLREHTRCHEKPELECLKCFRKYNCTDHFTSHIAKCNGPGNITFVQPTSLYSESS